MVTIAYTLAISRTSDLKVGPARVRRGHTTGGCGKGPLPITRDAGLYFGFLTSLSSQPAHQEHETEQNTFMIFYDTHEMQ